MLCFMLLLTMCFWQPLNQLSFSLPQSRTLSLGFPSVSKHINYVCLFPLIVHVFRRRSIEPLPLLYKLN